MVPRDLQLPTFIFESGAVMLLRSNGFALAVSLWATSCSAATYYVAANGSGSECTRTAPCSSLTTAVSVASAGDAVYCLSAPAPFAILINKSITIDCGSPRAPVRDGGWSVNGGLAAIVIAIPVASNDPLRTVRLRGLSLDGTGPISTPSGRYLDRGIDIQSALVVHIEDCVISNFNQQGVYDHRTGGKLDCTSKTL